jgi:hypothetical protein
MSGSAMLPLSKTKTEAARAQASRSGKEKIVTKSGLAPVPVATAVVGGGKVGAEMEVT